MLPFFIVIVITTWWVIADRITAPTVLIVIFVAAISFALAVAFRQRWNILQALFARFAHMVVFAAVLAVLLINLIHRDFVVFVVGEMAYTSNSSFGER